jgi:hypothetical protein
VQPGMLVSLFPRGILLTAGTSDAVIIHYAVARSA